MNKIKNIKQNLISFLKEEVLKTGLKKITLGLSGGLDSAVVAVLCKEVFDDNLNCVLMPSQYSSKASVEDAVELCKKFDIKYEIVSIEPMLSAYLKNMIDENRSKDELLALGFEDEFIEDIKKRVKINEFKRKLPIIAKI